MVSFIEPQLLSQFMAANPANLDLDLRATSQSKERLTEADD